jgi:hypothetical protein
MTLVISQVAFQMKWEDGNEPSHNEEIVWGATGSAAV